MKADELRERQRTVKQRYRDDPASARIPARAEGVVDLDALSCRVETGSGAVVAGLHSAAGGDGQDSCSADILLQALVACVGVTLGAVATSMSVPLRSARVLAEGHWDARGTLAVDRDAPVGLTDIALTLVLDTEADDAAVERLVEVTERYCVIAQTLASPPVLSFAARR